MEIGRKIREVRKSKDLTLKQLATAVGFSEQAISQYELGKRPITIGTLRKIATALDVHISELVSPDLLDDMESSEEYEQQKRFERAIEELEDADFTVYQDEKDHWLAIWRISHEEAGIATIATEAQIISIVTGVLADAEEHKLRYIKRRLITEFK